jgi:hypothetical protein
MGELAIHLIFPNMPKLNVDGMRRKNEKNTQNCYKYGELILSAMKELLNFT